FRALSRISEIEAKRRVAGFAAVDPAPILRQIASLYEPLALQGSITLALVAPEDHAIECDPELLFEAIGNLVDNAVKFTPPGGHVTIELDRAAQGPRICVSDTGPGIAESQRKLVLQRFYRTAEMRAVPGSGLGLSLVDAIVRLHDFALAIEENEQGGTRVRLLCWPQTVLLG
ncbi:MAG TPA: ATP-binding protein, partial [Rudaea sp.]